MSQTRIFLDTNILVYAHDASSPHHATAADLIAAVFEKRFAAVLSEQNLFELYRILTNASAMKGKALQPIQTKELIETVYLNGSFQVVYPTEAVLRQGLQLAADRNITSAKIFDLRLAATAVAEKVDYFVTLNIKDFRAIPNLTPLLPQQALEF